MSGDRWPDLLPRIGSGLALAVVAGGLLVAGGWWSTLLVAVLGCIMVREWRHITLGGCQCQADYGMGWLGVAGGVVATHLQGPWAGCAFVLAAALLGALADRMQGRNWRWGLLGLVYIGWACVGFVWLRDQPQGLVIAVGLALIVVGTDVGAYFAGRLFGGPKLAPVLSPRKTWSGLLGGVGLSMIAGGAWVEYTGAMPLAQLLPLAVAAAVVAQAGDIAESAIKRRFGVKDSGHWLPGHGGALDRFDGFLAVSLLATMALLIREWS